MESKKLKAIVLGVGLVLGLSSSAQCTGCQNVNGDMETQTAPITAGNNWINNELTNWNVSHGDPSIGTTPNTNIWMWSYWHHSGYQRGEGVYTEFNFVSGQTYTICYDLWRDANSNPASTFRAELANGLTPYFGGGLSWDFGAATPSSTQPLTTQPWVSTGSWVTITETFTANANYGQLWLYPLLNAAPNPGQAACRIDNVCIRQATVDPCDFEPKFVPSSSIDGCSVIFEDVTNYPTDPGFTVLDVSWTFGDGTSGNGSTVSHYYTNSGTYNVCMTVWTTNGEECCKKTYCMKIPFEAHCDPCEVMNNAQISVSGTGPVTFSAVGIPTTIPYGYLWDFGDGSTGTGQTVTHAYNTSGVYNVCLTIFYYDPERRACCSIRLCREIEAEASKKKSAMTTSNEIKDESAQEPLEPINELTVYPNPNQGEFSIALEGDVALETISVYDQTGKLVFHEAVESSQRQQLDLSFLDQGVYFLIVNEAIDQNRKFGRIVIE